MTLNKDTSAAGGNMYEDFSGISHTPSENPYNALIEACGDDVVQIQSRYEIHRETRNTQQKSKLLSPEFLRLDMDPILYKLVNPTQCPDYTDPRNCLVFWARPPAKIRKIVADIQHKLLSIAPHIWLMPLDCLHMTALEIIHSLTAPEIEHRIKIMGSTVVDITDYTFDHRARLIKPMISYDSAAIALSFVPAAGEGVYTKEGHQSSDSYTYHHLRRDLYDLCSSTGVTVESRYVVPSSHITIARFVTQKDISIDGNQDVGDPAKMKILINSLEETNLLLQKEFWPREEHDIVEDGQWIVGEEKGLECRKGTLWYGGGETIRLGKGFEIS